MKRLIAATLALAAAGIPSSASAVAEFESFKTVSAIILFDATTAVVGVDDPGPSAACGFTWIIFDPTTDLGRNFYGTLLAAKLTENLVDIGYDRVGAACTMTTLIVR